MKLKALAKLALHSTKVKAVAAAVVAGGGAATLGVTMSTGPAHLPPHLSRSHLAARADGCRQAHPLANVYHAYRLKVRKLCLTVIGTVAYIRKEDDGDFHVALKLLPSEDHLLNKYNDLRQYGQLVTEIVPADEPGCTPGKAPKPPHGSYNYGICTGADIRVPPLGALVKETGPYVLDADHGWMEIHPVWQIIILRLPVPTTTTTSSTTSTTTTTTTTTAPPPPPVTAPPTTEPTTTTAPPTTVAGAWCKAYSVPANDGYAGDYDVHVSSDEPHTTATAHSATDTYSYETDAQGSAVIYLWHQSAGEAVTVTVGPATCDTTDS